MMTASLRWLCAHEPKVQNVHNEPDPNGHIDLDSDDGDYNDGSATSSDGDSSEDNSAVIYETGARLRSAF